MASLGDNLKRLFGVVAYGAGVVLNSVSLGKGVLGVFGNLATGVGTEFNADVAETDFESFGKWLENHNFNKNFAKKLKGILDTPELVEVVKDIVKANSKKPYKNQPPKKLSGRSNKDGQDIDFKARDVAMLSRIWLCQYNKDNIKQACQKSKQFTNLGDEKKAIILEFFETSCSIYLEDAYDGLEQDYKVLASVIIRSLGSQISALQADMKAFAKYHPVKNTDKVNLNKATVKEILHEAYTLKCPFCGNVDADTLSDSGNHKYKCGNCDTIFFCGPASSLERKKLKSFISNLANRILGELSSLIAVLDQNIEENFNRLSEKVSSEGEKTRECIFSVNEKQSADHSEILDVVKKINSKLSEIDDKLLKSQVNCPESEPTMKLQKPEDHKDPVYAVKASPPVHKDNSSLVAEDSLDNDFQIKNGVLIKYQGTAKEIFIPDSVTSIGMGAFRSCTSPTSITIPDSVTSIGEQAFAGCVALASITIPDSVTSIGIGAFRSCTSLTSITIPDSVTSIGQSAFRYCTSLTSITIPDSVTSIGAWAFENCESLEKIHYTGTEAQWRKIKGVQNINEDKIIFSQSQNSTNYSDKDFIRNAQIENGALIAYKGTAKEIVIPDFITRIENRAFFNCTSLTSINIPISVTSIGELPFLLCDSIKTIYYRGTKEQWRKINGVQNINKDKIIFSQSQNSTNYSGNDFIRNAQIEDGVLIKYKGPAKKIVIPYFITSIGPSAFSDCKALTSISILGSVTSIGRSAFSSCTSLTSITIPDSVMSIGMRAFCSCTSLTSITIPKSVTRISIQAFFNCTSLTSIIIPDSVTSIGQSAFRYCTSLTSINIPDSVTSIGKEAFAGCSSLKRVYYQGSEAQWAKIEIADSTIKKCTMVFNAR